MPGFFVRWLITAVGLLFTSWIIRGIFVDGVGAALIAALVLGILNALLRPLLLLLTLPVNLLTLGLFTLVINGAMLKLTSAVVSGFHVEGFWSAVIGALVLSVFSFAVTLFIADSGRVEYVYVGRTPPGIP